MSELALGTAQFGDRYGVTNEQGRLDDQSIAAILHEAVEGGIEIFDTASGYGDAEQRTGALMPTGIAPRYVTKFAMDENPTERSVYGRSLERLSADHLAGLLVHRIADLEDSRFPTVLHLLREASESGVVERYGVSVYDVDDLELALRVMPELGLVQIPGSIVDRRLLGSTLIAELRARGVEVHVRSAFLQGLLLSDPHRLPPRFAALAVVLRQLDAWSARSGVNRIDLILRYLRDHGNVDAVVVGVTTAEELVGILRAWRGAGVAELPGDVFDLPEQLLDPRRWA